MTNPDTVTRQDGDASLSGLDRAAIDRFCCQYLQLETHLDYPDNHLLKRPDVQEEFFVRMFSAEASPSKNSRFQLRALKELVARIQASISDDESDDYEVSDNLMERLGELMFHPLLPEADEAQQKTVVTYHMSLLQPPAVIDILENRSLISAGGTTGLRTWEAALHLGQYLCVNDRLVAGRRVLELGAGTGYLSILCAKCLGVAHVIASDGADEVVDNLADNFALNNLGRDLSSSCESRISPKLLRWGHALVGTEEPEWIGGQKIDLIIGADITYDQKVIPSLVATLRELLGLYPDAEIIIAATQRNLETLVAFQDACSRSRLRIEELEFSAHEQQDIVELRGQPLRDERWDWTSDISDRYEHGLDTSVLGHDETKHFRSSSDPASGNENAVSKDGQDEPGRQNHGRSPQTQDTLHARYRGILGKREHLACEYEIRP